MTGQQITSIVVEASARAPLGDALAARGLSLVVAPAHAAWQRRGDGVVATLYNSGKLVVQGRDTDDIVALAQSLGGAVRKQSGGTALARTGESAAHDATRADQPRGAAAPFAAAIAKLPSPAPAAWIGVDEAGKGDYFGPLIVTAARVHVDQLPLLQELGVADSKALSDKRVKELARLLKSVVPFKRVLLMPPRYNELYAKTRNLNRLLAWAHATSIETLLESGVDAELALSDQFAPTDLITPRLKERGRAIRFVQRTKAEEDPAVACASIYARAEFLFRLDELEGALGMPLHKGAGPPVLAAARAIVRAKGEGALADVAKLHFRTTEQVCAP